MLLPLTNKEGTGMMLKVIRRPGGWAAQFVVGLTIFHCVGGRDPELCQRLEAGFAESNFRSVQSVRRDPHDPDSHCWLHVEGSAYRSRPLGTDGQVREDLSAYPLSNRPAWPTSHRPSKPASYPQIPPTRQNVMSDKSVFFRDQVALNHWIKGRSIDDLRDLLGHADVKMTQKYYSPWCKARETTMMDKL